jgi:translation elongation factor EF-1alpha
VLVEILGGSSDMIVVTKGFRSMIHIHADSTECQIERILETLDRKGKVLQKNPTIVNRATLCKCILHLDKVICVDKYDDVSHTGRFVLRKNDKSFGIGKVLKVSPYN